MRRRPDMPSVLVQLALLQRKAGRLMAAVDALRRAVALNPQDAGAAALLGSYLNEAGRPAEAAALLEPYAGRPDPAFDAVLARGIALARLGRGREALAAFDRARAVDASNPMPLVQAATVQMLAGRDAQARSALEDALRIKPDLALAHHNLGLLALRRRDTAEAERRFRRALELNPAEHDALLQLGSLLARENRAAEAGRCSSDSCPVPRGRCMTVRSRACRSGCGGTRWPADHGDNVAAPEAGSSAPPSQPAKVSTPSTRRGPGRFQ